MDEEEIVPPGYYKVALMWGMVNNSYDYHWYRQTSDGTWAHKPGQTAAKKTDSSGNSIYVPSQADISPYTVLIGYYALKPPSTYATTSVATATVNNTLDKQETFNIPTATSLLLSDFNNFEIGVSNRTQIETNVGKPSEFSGSGMIWDVYHTVDGYQVNLLYGNEDILSELTYFKE